MIVIGDDNVFWKVLIITKDYERISEYFMYYANLNGSRRAKYETHIHSDFLIIDIYRYFNNIDKFRGHRADLIYIDSNLYDDKDVYSTLTSYGVVLPLSILVARTGDFNKRVH